MDGLLLKIAYDFLLLLERRGLSSTNIRIKFLPKDPKFRVSTFQTAKNLEDFKTQFGPIIFDRRFLCSSGDYPIIENVVLTNNNLKFKNSYSWSNITDLRKFVRTIQYDDTRKDIYEAEIKRYLTLCNDFFDEYTKNINMAIKERQNTYVDPCYVDAGYISPN